MNNSLTVGETPKLFYARRYRSGSKWAFWRWTRVVLDSTLYLLRLHILQTPLGSAMVHWIYHADPQPDTHDHPVWFMSFVLRGWYREQTPNGMRMIRWFNIVRPQDRHRIDAVSPGGVVTLVFCGRGVRTWGFHTAKGWIPWMDYKAPAN